MAWTLERREDDGAYRALKSFDDKDTADRIAEKLTRTSGTEHRVTETP